VSGLNVHASLSSRLMTPPSFCWYNLYNLVTNKLRPNLVFLTSERFEQLTGRNFHSVFLRIMLTACLFLLVSIIVSPTTASSEGTLLGFFTKFICPSPQVIFVEPSLVCVCLLYHFSPHTECLVAFLKSLGQGQLGTIAQCPRTT